jgi:hypothetical protein
MHRLPAVLESRTNNPVKAATAISENRNRVDIAWPATDGTAATHEEAMAKFREVWEKANAEGRA